MKIKKNVLLLIVTLCVTSSIVACGKNEKKSLENYNKSNTESTQNKDANNGNLSAKSTQKASDKINQILHELNVTASDLPPEDNKLVGFKGGGKIFTYKSKSYVIGELIYDSLTAKEKEEIKILRQTHKINISEHTTVSGYYNANILILDTNTTTTIDPEVIAAMDKLK